ncbi:Hint domain-containing protein [Pararhodobacter sp.]
MSAGQGDFGVIAEGLLAGTTVATDQGWLPVETLRAGDRVVTFDHGMRPVKAVRISKLWTAAQGAPRAVWPLLIPARVLGNRSETRLLPEQSVLIESDAAEEMYGDPFTMVAAGTLEGYMGITRVPPTRELTVVSLKFEGDEVVYTNGTMLVHCPNPRPAMVATADELMSAEMTALYQKLTDQQARSLVEAMAQSA